MARTKNVTPATEDKSTFRKQADKFDELALKLREMVKYWKYIMGLDYWDFTIMYVAEPLEGIPDAQAAINVQPSYQQAVIKFVLPRLIGEDDLRLEEVVAHELAHCHTNAVLFNDPLTKEDRRILERLTTEISRALIRVKFDKNEKSSGKNP